MLIPPLPRLRPSVCTCPVAPAPTLTAEAAASYYSAAEGTQRAEGASFLPLLPRPPNGSSAGWSGESTCSTCHQWGGTVRGHNSPPSRALVLLWAQHPIRGIHARAALFGSACAKRHKASHRHAVPTRAQSRHLSPPGRWSPEQFYTVVSNVSDYHKFVPWCQKSKVVRMSGPEHMEAELEVGFQMLTER